MSLHKKFRIKPGQRLAALNAPSGMKDVFGPLPEKSEWVKGLSGYDHLHWFVSTKAQLEKDWPRVKKSLKDQAILWIYFPKASSGRQTDLTRDKGWDCLQPEENRLQHLTLVSFDDTWSVVAYRMNNESIENTQTAKPEREVFRYIDPVTREITLPDYLEKAFLKNKKALAVYNKLPFTHKKEYLEWVITAKKEETRLRRIEGMMERLTK